MLYNYLFDSRNKDNKDIPGFVQRQWACLSYDDKDSVLKMREKFSQFVKQGVPGELCRMYRSVNGRDEDKARKSFLIYMIQYEPTLTRIKQTLTSCAQKPENRAEYHWLFDFDEKEPYLVTQFASDIEKYGGQVPDIYPTVNGYALVVDHGFDTRQLLDDYRNYDITLLKDGMLLLDWDINEISH